MDTTVAVTGPLALGSQNCPLAHTHTAPPLPWALHTLTICVGFINGDHALGLRMETKRNIEGGEGWKTQAPGWGTKTP